MSNVSNAAPTPKPFLKSKAGKITAFTLVAFFCVCCGLVATFVSDQNTTTAPAIVESSNTALPQPTRTAIPMNSPTPSEDGIANPLIPGLHPSDVTVNLEERGFTCSEVEQGQSYYIRSCKRDEAGILSMIVQVYGSELFSVDYIETTVLQSADPKTELASPLLGFMATMPYTGSQPEEARAWVENGLLNYQEGNEVSTTIAGVPYRLSGPVSAITLEMGELK